MSIRPDSRLLSVALALLALQKPARCDEPADPAVPPSAAPAQPREAVERALAFLEADALAWRTERKCATCHHGTMTVWALTEAKSRGLAVNQETLTQIIDWTKERFSGLDKPRDTRPGWNMVNTPAIHLALMAHTLPAQYVITAEDLQLIAGHLLRHQEADGSWAWSIAPPKNRPPPVFESDEVVTLMASVILEQQLRLLPESADRSTIVEGRGKAAAWLASSPPGDTTQAAALRLLADIQAGKPADELEPQIRGLLGRRNPDGGWGQVPGVPSDAFATGQALYFLSVAGVPSDRPEIGQAVAFLINTQNDNGSWPMTSRAHPGAEPFTNPVPITHFGSAWATLGLVRTLPQ